MTTKHSPLRILKAQADRMAAIITAAERGEPIDIAFAEKIEAARAKDSVSFAVIMDDKVITIELPWETIRSTGEVGLSEYIVRQMREARDTLQ